MNSMALVRTAAILISAAVLEAGGDALIRHGLQRRPWLLLLGAASLAVYGVLVNQGGLPFGRLLGSYIVVFFVVSQIVAVVVFRDVMPWQTVVGGTLIIAGGCVLVA
jgi:drug/metabolite transporter superfamily protein YnfA